MASLEEKKLDKEHIEAADSSDSERLSTADINLNSNKSGK